MLSKKAAKPQTAAELDTNTVTMSPAGLLPDSLLLNHKYRQMASPL